MPKSRKILLVDDDEAILKFEHKILTAKGYICGMARGGNEALEMLTREKYHLVVLDVMMPDIDGFKVSERIQRDPELGSPYVIFVTARDDMMSVSEGFAAGGVLYLTKPFTSSKLLDVVRAVTEMG